MIIPILLKLTAEEKNLLLSTVSKLGTTTNPAVSLQLKIVNAILEVTAVDRPYPDKEVYIQVKHRY